MKISIKSALKDTGIQYEIFTDGCLVETACQEFELVLADTELRFDKSGYIHVDAIPFKQDGYKEVRFAATILQTRAELKVKLTRYIGDLEWKHDYELIDIPLVNDQLLTLIALVYKRSGKSLPMSLIRHNMYDGSFRSFSIWIKEIYD